MGQKLAAYDNKDRLSVTYAKHTYVHHQPMWREKGKAFFDPKDVPSSARLLCELAYHTDSARFPVIKPSWPGSYLAHPVAHSEADDPRGQILALAAALRVLMRLGGRSVVLEVDDGAVRDLYVAAEIDGRVEEVFGLELLHPAELAARELDLRTKGEMQGEGCGGLFLRRLRI